jgi:hypothetical protein
VAARFFKLPYDGEKVDKGCIGNMESFAIALRHMQDGQLAEIIYTRSAEQDEVSLRHFILSVKDIPTVDSNSKGLSSNYNIWLIYSPIQQVAAKSRFEFAKRLISSNDQLSHPLSVRKDDSTETMPMNHYRQTGRLVSEKQNIQYVGQEQGEQACVAKPLLLD